MAKLCEVLHLVDDVIGLATQTGSDAMLVRSVRAALLKRDGIIGVTKDSTSDLQNNRAAIAEKRTAANRDSAERREDRS